ncbi:MAG: transglycosylase domain-containing protein [Clostridia bacterium]|nr:transglycosylase domain-containing protein [Clostridia bacterium]
MAEKKKKIRWGKEISDAGGTLVHAVRGVFAAIGCILLTVLIVGILCGLIVGTAMAVYLSDYVDASIDQFDVMAYEQKQTSQIYIDTGSGSLSELEDQKLYASENRVWVDYADIPKHLIDAYISIEDKRFLDHNGVDWLRTFKATVYYALGNSSEAGGGSTLTQQLIKNITGNKDNTPQRKVREMFEALNLEKKYSKEQILEMYLNSIYLSQGCNGVQSASYTYFGKPVKQLGLLECAAIAAITQNPSRWDPKIHPENNIIRRNNILGYMLDQGKITKAEYDACYNKELEIYDPDYEDTGDETPADEKFSSDATSWYVDVVIEDSIALLMERFGVTYGAAEKMLYTGGYKIVTAMDPKVQSVLDAAFTNTDIIDAIIGASPGMIKPQASIVVVDPRNGNILGLVGGRGEKLKSRVFNYATQAKRQTGSSIKPLSLYGPALEAGVINYATTFEDSPFRYDDGVGWPRNSPLGYKGLVPIITGITNSINTIAIKVVNKLGLEQSFRFLTEKLHITSLYRNKEVNGKIYNDVTLASLGLGGMTEGVSVREMVGGFTMFTNDGIYCQPRAVLKICDRNGEVLVNNEIVTEVCMSKENASIMTKMLNNVVVNGTGISTKLKNYVFSAGKTGTTSKNCDKWFIGFTPYYLAGVWFGYEKAQSLSNFAGNPAMKIWDYVMTELHNANVFVKNPDGSYDYNSDRSGNKIAKTYADVQDSGVLTAEFCCDCGKLAGPNCADVTTREGVSRNRMMTGYFTVDNMPTEVCTCHTKISFCTEGNHLAGEYCPASSVEERYITVSDFARDRYTFEGEKVYTYMSDESYVFYDQGDGTYGGLLDLYASYCKVHRTPSQTVLAANGEAPLAHTYLSEADE